MITMDAKRSARCGLLSVCVYFSGVALCSACTQVYKERIACVDSEAPSGQSVSLSCPPRHTLHFNRVQYRVSRMHSCDDAKLATRSCYGHDMTSAYTNKCSHKSKCDMQVNYESEYENSCYGYTSYLHFIQIEFKCDPEPLSSETESLHLCSEGTFTGTKVDVRSSQDFNNGGTITASACHCLLTLGQGMEVEFQLNRLYRSASHQLCQQQVAIVTQQAEGGNRLRPTLRLCYQRQKLPLDTCESNQTHVLLMYKNANQDVSASFDLTISSSHEAAFTIACGKQDVPTKRPPDPQHTSLTTATADRPITTASTSQPSTIHATSRDPVTTSKTFSTALPITTIKPIEKSTISAKVTSSQTAAMEKTSAAATTTIYPSSSSSSSSSSITDSPSTTRHLTMSTQPMFTSEAEVNSSSVFSEGQDPSGLGVTQGPHTTDLSVTIGAVVGIGMVMMTFVVVTCMCLRKAKRTEKGNHIQNKPKSSLEPLKPIYGPQENLYEEIGLDNRASYENVQSPISCRGLKPSEDVAADTSTDVTPAEVDGNATSTNDEDGLGNIKVGSDPDGESEQPAVSIKDRPPIPTPEPDPTPPNTPSPSKAPSSHASRAVFSPRSSGHAMNRAAHPQNVHHHGQTRRSMFHSFSNIRSQPHFQRNTSHKHKSPAFFQATNPNTSRAAFSRSKSVNQPIQSHYPHPNAEHRPLHPTNSSPGLAGAPSTYPAHLPEAQLTHPPILHSNSIRPYRYPANPHCRIPAGPVHTHVPSRPVTNSSPVTSAVLPQALSANAGTNALPSQAPANTTPVQEPKVHLNSTRPTTTAA